ncbi:MAG TPA: glycosyltransferase [Casimicrobiaceae bacterium]|nr:glycosyltransferase [Casimicrobiaceae bacterium]
MIRLASSEDGAQSATTPEARIGIVVLTHDRREEALRTLRHLHDGNDIPITVVDNGSSDGTADAVSVSYPDVSIVRLADNMGVAGRNAGVHACRARYIAFCDDDTWWDVATLEHAAAALDSHPTLAVVTARVLVGDDAREDPASARMAASPFPNTLALEGREVLGFLAGACMFRRTAFLAAGGYEPRLFIGREERLLAIDLLVAGWRMAYLPVAVVHHQPSHIRNRRARQRLLLRNGLWCAWLRRPLASALRESLGLCREGHRDGTLIAGVLAALRGLPWVVRARCVVEPGIEAALRRLDAFDAQPMPEYRPIIAAAPRNP